MVAIVVATGGVEFHIGRALVRANDPGRALIVSLLSLGAYAFFYGDDFGSVGDRIVAYARNTAPLVGIVAAGSIGVVAICFGTFTAGGSDSYGYVSQAYGWAGGELPAPIPLPLEASWTNADVMQTPLGYRVGPRPNTMVPTYAAGLPLLMALAIKLCGVCGPFLITPVCSALLVWCTFLLGRRLAGPIAGAIACIVVATTPAVLFQAISPMSDVPAGALWTGALVAAMTDSKRYALTAGFCAALGLLIRPNLIPLCALPLFIAITGSQRERWIRAALVLLPLVPAAIFIAWLNTTWYGSPLASGYGNAGDIYALRNVWPNLRRYTTWFLQSESPWAVIALVPLLKARGQGAQRSVVLNGVIAIALTLVCYLPYLQFEAWWYLRFLLPAAGAAAALIACGIVVLARIVPAPWGRLASYATFVALVTTTLSFASRADVFGGIRAGEQRYIDAGQFVARALPVDAVVFAMQHSGSVRFYGGRMTLRYDWIDRSWVAQASNDLARLGLHPYLVVDDFEIPQVSAALGIRSGAALPFAIVARMQHPGGPTVFDMGRTAGESKAVPYESPMASRCIGAAIPLKVFRNR